MDTSMDRHMKTAIHTIHKCMLSIVDSNENYQMYDHVLPSSFGMFFILFPERNSKCMTTYCLIVAGSSQLTSQPFVVPIPLLYPLYLVCPLSTSPFVVPSVLLYLLCGSPAIVKCHHLAECWGPHSLASS